MDIVFNRHTRIAKFAHGQDVYMLLDAQLIELTRERMILSGIEREKDELINKVEDFAQTWVCWFVKNEKDETFTILDKCEIIGTIHDKE